MKRSYKKRFVWVISIINPLDGSIIKQEKVDKLENSSLVLYKGFKVKKLRNIYYRKIDKYRPVRVEKEFKEELKVEENSLLNK